MGKMHYLKVEDYVLFSGFTEDLSPGYSLSDSSEGLFQRGNGRAKIHRSFYKKTSNNLGFVGYQVSVIITQVSSCSVKATIGNI